MNQQPRRALWLQLLLLIIIMLPLVILFFLPLPGGSLLSEGMWFFLMLLVCFWVLSLLFGTRAPVKQPPAVGPRTVPPEEQPAVIREVLDVRFAEEEQGVVTFHGRLRDDASVVYEKLKKAFTGQTVPLLQEGERHGAAIILLPKQVETTEMEQPARPWVHWLLFGLTILTTTWAGAAQHGVDVFQEPSRLAEGLPFSIGLLSILGVHELGHYFAARRHGMRVTPPYFIPLPFALGTFGAFIQMRSPPENRRVLFDVAVSGPLAGLVVAIPVLLIGLQDTTVVQGKVIGGEITPPNVVAPAEKTTPPMVVGGASAGSSLLLALLAKLAMPEALQHGCVLQFGSLAFAGWIGIFITGLNLLPVGQLDGGHTARALFGYRAGGAISSLAMWSLLLLGLFVWPGLLMWAVIVFFIAGAPTPPLNDLTPITPGRRWIGYATFAILILIVTPLPRALWPAAGIYCPYM